MQRSDLVEQPSAVAVPPARLAREALRPWLGGWRGGVIAGTLVIAAGLYLGWGWLAAVGAAPIILALAPCLVCCAAMGVGMCAMPKGTKPTPSAAPDQAGPAEIRGADTDR